MPGMTRAEKMRPGPPFSRFGPACEQIGSARPDEPSRLRNLQNLQVVMKDYEMRSSHRSQSAHNVSCCCIVVLLLGPASQVSGRLCEAKPEAKSPWRDTHGDFRESILGV